jgi:pimeloyl-ACP methyl ester carboxylesterase
VKGGDGGQVEESGHNVTAERPAEFAKLVRDFIRRG